MTTNPNTPRPLDDYEVRLLLRVLDEAHENHCSWVAEDPDAEPAAIAMFGALDRIRAAVIAAFGMPPIPPQKPLPPPRTPPTPTTPTTRPKRTARTTTTTTAAPPVVSDGSTATTTPAAP